MANIQDLFSSMKAVCACVVTELKVHVLPTRIDDLT